ncbi:MAG TPA: HAMP domain-containing sensor histidine kinase [Burkholderiaceae bacterium]|nr:HAMP domain-containing sensor histidine kinase [Burkholderiaceae bacterium]
MANAIAHDIKQPLSAISAAVAAMSVHRRSPEENALIGIVETAVRDIARMTSSLVDCVILGGQPQTHPTAVCVAALIEEIRRSHILMAQASGVTLRAASQAMELVTDRDLLSRALRNMLSNAIQHAKATKVLVRARRRGDSCEIDVADNGVGIAPHHLPRIWELGWRGPTERSGTGLGLYAARAFVDAIEGTIEVRSSPGRGTLFRIRLPGPIMRLPPATAVSSQREAKLAGFTVAVLDDERPVLEATSAAFSSRGARVIAHTDALHLLHDLSLQPTPPDLLLLDFLLGQGQTATPFLQLLRHRYGSSPRAVILTAHPNHPDLQQVSDVIVFEKPLSRQHIDRLVGYLRGELSWDDLAQTT